MVPEASILLQEDAGWRHLSCLYAWSHLPHHQVQRVVKMAGESLKLSLSRVQTCYMAEKRTKLRM